MTTPAAVTRPVHRPITVEAVGAPVAVSALARILLRMHVQPALHLVPQTDEQPSRPLPPQQQGPQ